MLMIMVLTLMVSCGSDDDEIDSSPYSSVIGSWSGPRYDGANKDSKGKVLLLVFKSDGTGTFVEEDQYKRSNGTFTYLMEGSNKGKIRFDGYATYEYFFMIEGNKMNVYDKGYGDDIEWTLTKE